MRTYDEAYAAAKDEPAFSNGSEGDAWMERWCETCVQDAVYQRTGEGTGCPLVGVAVLGRTPVEWLDQTEDGTHYLGDTYLCTEYRDADDTREFLDGPYPHIGERVPASEHPLGLGVIHITNLTEEAGDG